MVYATNGGKSRSRGSSDYSRYASRLSARAHRREHRRGVTAAIFAFLRYTNKPHRQYTQRRTSTEFDWDAWSSRLSEREFKQWYRLSKTAFNTLVEELRPTLTRRAHQQINVSGRVIRPEVMVAATLRWLAGEHTLTLTLTLALSAALCSTRETCR